MTPPFGLNVDDYLNMDFGLDDGTDPEDSSLVRPSDVDLYEHGVASPYQDKAMLLSSAQAKAEDNAMSYLMQALNKQADISPEQGIATALLAAIPTFGGYMIGKSVGSPKLPPGYFEAGGTRAAIGLDKIGDPAAEGGLAGAVAGAKSAQGYIGALEADKAQKNDIYQKMAAIESQKAGRLESQAATLDAQRIAREDNQAFQRSMIDERLQAQKELAGYRQDLKPEGFGAQDIADPVTREAFNRISAGMGQPSDYSLLTPEAIKQANQNARSAAYARSVDQTQERFDTKQGYAQGYGTVVIAPNGNDPSLNKPRAEIVAARNQAMSAANKLALSYDKTSGAFLGIDRATEAALASQLFSAARQLAKTGMRLEGKEAELVAALSSPQLDISGATEYLDRYLTQGGDPATLTRSVANVLGTAYNEQLKGYGQIFKEYASETPPMTTKTAPVDGGISQQIEELKAKIAAVKARLGVK